MDDDSNRAYMLVAIQPGKQQEFADEIMSLGLTQDTAVNSIDFVHGTFDFIITFKGAVNEVDKRILEIRSLPHLLRTETMIPFHRSSMNEPRSQESLGGRREPHVPKQRGQDSSRMKSPLYMGKMLDATHPHITHLGSFY